MTDREPRRPSLPGDPSGIEEPHDVLAADEFGIGTRYDRLPPDPTGIREPHDVLAAEEFAMPAGVEPHGEIGRLNPRTLVPLVLLVTIAVIVVVRRRS